MDSVKSLADLFKFWPEGSIATIGGEHKAPCPFCNGDEGEIQWAGVDRFVIYADQRGAYCRQCAHEGRGDSGKGYYHLSTVARRFGLEVADDFKYEQIEAEEVPLSGLWTDKEVESSHKLVDYAFWLKEYGWPKALVDIFRLGMGRLFARHTHHLHTIPMKGLVRYGEDPLKHNYMATRFRTPEGKKLKERNAGSSKSYLWHYQGNPESKDVAVIEGDTDGITAWYLGFRNFVATFGSNTWMPEKAKFLKEFGYERVTILSDGDSAGKHLAAEASDSLYQVGFQQVLQIDWQGRNQDISALYKETCDPIVTRAWIDNHLVEPEMRVQLRNKRQELARRSGDATIMTIDDLREGDKSIQAEIDRFILSYAYTQRKGHGVALHLQAPPGAGKTHTLVKTAEKIAALVKEARDEEKAQLITAIEVEEDPDTKEKMQKKLANWTETSVAWYGQYKEGWNDLIAVGASDELWYNYEARNDDNCENIKRVNELGAKHHDIGYFCRTSCPFFAKCSEEGYWKQETERKEKPITFFRHQHLMAQYNADYKGLIVVDEFAGSVLDGSPLIFEAKHIYPHNQTWEMDTGDAEMTEAVETFTRALRAVLSLNVGRTGRDDDYIISGAAFLRQLDSQVKGIQGIDLATLLERIDQSILSQIYQPNFSGDEKKEVALRCIPQTFDAIMREMPDYNENPNHDYPSCLHLVSGQLEIYAHQRIYARHKTPMIIADATGLPALYQAMFGREVKVFAPLIRNPNARVEILRGSDWTNTEVKRQLGKQMADKKRSSDAPVMTLDGEEFDPKDVPVSPDLYQANVLREATAIVKKLSERHRSLLVVTHKNLKELVESLVEATWPEEESGKQRGVSFGHYGALRGTNKYEDYEAVVLIGVFRIPYSIVWRKLQMWAFLLGMRENIAQETERKEDYYDYLSPEGEMIKGELRTFNNDFAASFVDMIERGELEQSAARIRPHSSFKQKFIYVFANRPALQFVNFISEKKDFLKEATEVTKHKEVYEFLRNFRIKEGLYPSYRIVRSTFRTSNAVIQNLRAQIERELSE